MDGLSLDLIKVASPLALALIVIWLIVKQFLIVITNHLVHDQELHEKTIEAMNKLGDTIQSMEATQKENTRVMDNVLSFLQNHR